MDNSNIYFEHESIYTHGRSFFQYVVCKNHNGNIVGIYGDSDDISCDFFNFQITLMDGVLTTTFLDDKSACDQSLTQVFQELDKHRGSIDIDIRTNFSMFDLLRFQIEELVLNDVPNSGSDLCIGLDDSNTEIHQNGHSIDSHVFLDTEYQHIFEELFGVTASELSITKSKKKEVRRMSKVDGNKEFDKQNMIDETITFDGKTLDEMLEQIRRRRGHCAT